MRQVRSLQRVNVLALLLFAARTVSAQSLIQIDRRSVVSRADLTYETPATRSEEGMPVGNGRTGSLVWTTPSSLKLQINRVDVHAMDSTTVSFPRADSDYGSACGLVDVQVVDAGDDVFAGAAFRQHLSVYDALMTARGKGLTARTVAWPDGDVIAIEIDDQRGEPAAINVDLRMLRYQMQYEHLQLSAPAGKGRFTILIGSAESASPSADATLTALDQVKAAERKGFPRSSDP